METLLQRFFKHALKCKQCSEHPDNPCAIGGLILSAVASAFIISAQHGVRWTRTYCECKNSESITYGDCKYCTTCNRPCQ